MALRPVAHHRPAGVDDAMAASRITALGTRSGCLTWSLNLRSGRLMVTDHVASDADRVVGIATWGIGGRGSAASRWLSGEAT